MLDKAFVLINKLNACAEGLAEENSKLRVESNPVEQKNDPGAPSSPTYNLEQHEIQTEVFKAIEQRVERTLERVHALPQDRGKTRSFEQEEVEPAARTFSHV